SGAIVEREARGEIVCNGQVRLMLRQPDFVTARAIAAVINRRFPETAFPLDAGTVQVRVPRGMLAQVVPFVSDIGVLEVSPDYPARVVINERTGTVVAGAEVRISSVAVAHGNLSITTINQLYASQPAPLSQGVTTVIP